MSEYSKYAVRQADLDRDEDAVVAVWTQNLRSHDGPTHRAKFDWYYRRNPQGPGRCWVLEHGPDRQVVGTAGLGLRPLRVSGAPVTAGLASDFAVDPAHRVLRPALMLAKAVLGALDDGVSVIYGLPNAKSLPVFKYLRYNTDAKLQRNVKVLRVERFLRGVPIPGRSLGRRAVAGVVDPVLRAVSPETWRDGGAPVLQPVREFDERFDDLWRRTRDAFPVACERSSRFLRWRYATCPLSSYVTLALPGGGRSLRGYVVCLVGSDEQVRVIDLWAGADAPARDDLVAGLLSWARRRGAASVAWETGASEYFGKALARFGFRRRGAGLSVAVSPPKPGAPRVQADKWHFLPADEDYN